MDDDGPPQPQLTIVVNSTHHLVSGETDSQFHNGMGVDANDADDELDGPRVHGRGRYTNGGGGGRGGGRHHGHPRQHHGAALPLAGPATSATRAAGAHLNGVMSRSVLFAVDGAVNEDRDLSDSGGDEGGGGEHGETMGPGPSVLPAPRGVGVTGSASQRRRGEKRKRVSQLGLAANEGNGSVSAAGSLSGAGAH